MKIFYKYILIVLIILINSCDTNHKKEQKSEQIKKEVKPEIIIEKEKEDIYRLTENLLDKHFGKKIKHIDFKSNSKIKPHHFEFFNELGLINVRGYLNPTFNKSYISKNFENYTLFIFEYEDLSFAEKSFMTFEKDNKRILELIKNDEWNNPNKPSKNDIRTNRALKMSGYCKSGGMVFLKDNYIISIVKTCREPLTTKRMKWNEYEKLFLNEYLSDKENQTLILNAGCGDRNYKNEYFKYK